MALPSQSLPGPAQRQQLVEPLSCKAHISLGCLPGPLLERVKHIHGLGELGDVQNSVLQCRMHTDFADAGSDRGHGFPVERLQAALHPPKLEACESPGVSRKCSYVAPRRGHPLQCLISYGAIYKYRYIVSTGNRDVSHNHRVHLPALEIGDVGSKAH